MRGLGSGVLSWVGFGKQRKVSGKQEKFMSMLVAFWALLLLLCGLWAGKQSRQSLDKKNCEGIKVSAEGHRGQGSAIVT